LAGPDSERGSRADRAPGGDRDAQWWARLRLSARRRTRGQPEAGTGGALGPGAGPAPAAHADRDTRGWGLLPHPADARALSPGRSPLRVSPGPSEGRAHDHSPGTYGPPRRGALLQ